MSPDKAEIKLAVLHQQGSQWDDWLEAKVRQQAEMAGAVLALRQAREKLIAPIRAAVQEDSQAGKLATLDGLQILEYVQKQLTRVELALENMQMNAERERIIAEGRVAQMREVVAATKKAFDGARAAVDAHQAAVASGAAEESGRPVMPAAEDIEQRRAAARAEKAQVAMAPSPAKTTRKGGAKRGAANGAHT
jgi:hypothetical protein